MEHVQAAIVGAGQAGLAMSYCLTQAGIRHVLLERQRAGHAWRNERWGTFCLVTPNWQCRLPGHPYTGTDPQGFMLKHEIVEYLEAYVQSFRPPLREGVSVRSLVQAPEGYFELDTSAGPLRADQVVVATGGYHTPRVPDWAGALPSNIEQVHSRDYKCPERLPEGEVLVVGTGQSGCQIAEDLLRAGRRVHLCVGNAPRCARRHRGKDVVEWLEQMGHYDLPISQHASPDQVRDKTNHYVTGRDGGHDIDLREFALQGMQLYGSLRGLRGSQLLFAPDLRQNLDGADAVYISINRAIDKYIAENGIEASPSPEYSPRWSPEHEPNELDLATSGIRSIVWSIGFGVDFQWVELPVFDERGCPCHTRGVSEVPGLYFLGLPWQHTWGSARFASVGRDAEHLCEQLLERARGVPGTGVVAPLNAQSSNTRSSLCTTTSGPSLGLSGL
jgi:putative flavoprotein involved in K+ transport